MADDMPTGGAVECHVVPRGPAQGDLDEYRRRILEHPAVQELLGGTHHRLLAYELVDDAKSSTLRPPPNRYRATFYDYSNNRTVTAEGALDRPEEVRVLGSGTQPLPTVEEFAAAVELVRADPQLGPAIVDGRLRPYRPMPPLLEADQADGEGEVERTVNVGLLPSQDSQLPHEIVGVNMVADRLVRFEGRAPLRSMAVAATCGPPGAGQPTANRGTPGQYLVTVNQGGVELWRLLAVRPAASSGTVGSGIELRSVSYRGKKVLDRAHVPILNVRYDNDACGPYRDWQWQESRIPVDGTDVAPGFRISATPVQTILETGQDGGNFLGVGLYAQGEETVLISEMEAGWYRYISEWRLHNDGTIRPRFGFSAVQSSCVCAVHHHHVYWRFDFDIRTAEDNRVREFNDPPLSGADNWRTLRFESRRVRNASRQRKWSVEHVDTGEGYILTPGPDDGVADSFGVGDLWALQYRSGELDDGQGFTTDPARAMAQLDRFVSNRAPIDANDVVVWYAAHFTHDVGGSPPGDFGHQVGPELRPVNW
ncbi:MAG: hypothetical protein ACR2KO_14060 [Geodermatophilaceae bacterium]|nr:hypothetical protein [Gemmatimonadota bacterium]